MTIEEIQLYAREKASFVRNSIKEDFKELHYTGIIYNIVDMLEELKKEATSHEKNKK